MDHARVITGLVVESQDHAVGLGRGCANVGRLNALAGKILQHDDAPFPIAGT
jgi:hypothetical protein